MLNHENRETLTSKEIKNFISDSTISGSFGEENTKFSQRNHKNGIAIVNIEGMDIKTIPWFISEDDHYCEDWGKDGILRYKLEKDTSSDRYFLRAEGKTIETEIKIEKGFHSITLSSS